MRWLVAAVLVVSCGAPGVNRGVAEGGWHELSSENFTLVTDMPLDEAREKFRRLEQVRWALVDTYGLILPQLRIPPQRFRIVHFDRCRDFREIAGEGVAGFVTSSPDLQNTRVMVTCDTGAHSTLVHELSHVINAAVFADMPLWLNEGLASYYGTLSVRGGAVRIGEFPEQYKPLWQRATFLLSLDELRAAGAAAFYNLDKRAKNYFAAWKAVHMLNTSPDYRSRFRQYLLGLARGVADAEAWRVAFNGVDPGALARSYRYYQNRTELRHYQAPYRYRDEVAKPEVRSLRPGEAHAVWIGLQILRSRDPETRDVARAAVGRQLRLMEHDDPDWSGVLFWRAIAQAFDDRDAAIATLRRYVKREPDDHRAWYALVSLQVPRDLDGLEDSPPASLEPLMPDVLELVRVGHTPADLNLIGWYFALAQMPNTGLNFAQRAIAAEPSCGGCWDTLALLLYRHGNPAVARMVQKRAIGMMGDAAPDRSAIARLAAYERAAATAAAAAKPASKPEPPPKPEPEPAPAPAPAPVDDAGPDAISGDEPG